MATNTIGDFIRSVFPPSVNKDGKTFNALLADSKDNKGTIEKAFIDLDATRKVWTEKKSVYDQKGEQLLKTLATFSILSQMQNENEETFLRRNELLFYRGGHTVWGNKRNILYIFKQFFKNENVYIVNNTESYSDNLLVNGNFEKQEAWTIEDAVYEKEASFEGGLGLLFNGAGTCEQTVLDIEQEKTYFLHFFLYGDIRVQIIDNNGRYWNPSIGEFGAWSSSAHYISCVSQNEWASKDMYFITDDTVNEITIRFIHEPEKYAFLDYVRLNKKTRASTFSLIAVFDGMASGKTAVLAPGTDDEITGVDYELMSYFEDSFVFGATNSEAKKVYQELLNIVQPAGVTSVIEVLMKE